MLRPFVVPDGKWIGPKLEETSNCRFCRDWEDEADNDAWRRDEKLYAIAESVGWSSC